LYGAFVCIYYTLYFGQSATGKLVHVFIDVGWRVPVDFDSKYKTLWCETRAHGVPIHEEKKQSSKQESA